MVVQQFVHRPALTAACAVTGHIIKGMVVELDLGWELAQGYTYYVVKVGY